MFFGKRKNPVLKNSIVYMTADAFTRGISFLLLPIVSKYLLPEELGIAANFDVLQSILALLAGMATINAISYFFYKNPKEKIARLVSSLVLIIIVASMAFSLVIFMTAGYIQNYLHIGIALQLLAVVSTIALLVSDISKLLYRLEEKPYKFAALQLGQSILYIILQLFMVVHLEMQALGRIYSLVFSLLTFSILHIALLYKRGYLIWKFDTTSIKELLHFGLPLLPHSLSFWLKSGMDKILLTAYCGLAVNGLYSMAMSFGAIYSICEISFIKAYSPYLQKRISQFTPLNTGQEKILLVKQAYGFGALFIILYFVVMGICWLGIRYMVDVKYLPCFEFIPWILLSGTLHIFYSLTIEYIYTAKKTIGLGIITFIGSVIQLLLTYVLLRYLGKDGIKISMVVGSAIIMAGVWWYSNKVYPMPWFVTLKGNLWKKDIHIGA